ncbi:hypothetical protein DZC31_10210 [Stenotrophomonas rhizophila]|nr:hypothetical protein DZC31_10210 [Stenotrophomonas rhizophila]
MNIAIKEMFVCGENDLSAQINELVLPLALSRLRGQLTMPGLITINTKDESKHFGEEVTVPAPVVFGEADEFDPVEGSKPSPINAEGVKVKLDKHIYKEWTMSDREFMAHAATNTLPSAMEGAVDALAISMNKAIFSLYKDVGNFSGNLTSASPRDKKALIASRKVLQDNKVLGPRNLVLTSDTEADFLLELSKVNETGDQTLVNEGFIGRKFGWNIYSDVQAPTHFAGTASSVDGIVTTGINLAGSPVLRVAGVDEGATFVRGDIITIAGGYSVSVAADVTADDTGNVEVPVVGGLKLPLQPGVAVEVVGTHNVDLGFTPAAFMAAFRNLETPASSGGVTISSMSDPITGIPLRLLTWYNGSTRATHWSLEMFFGVKTIDPGRAVRMGGH